MKAPRILLFLAAAIGLLAGLCAFFPQKGVSIGFTHLRFPTLTKVLNPQRQMDLEAFLAEQDSIEAARALHRDSIAQYRRQLDSSSLRFWFPNNDDSFFDTLFAQLEQTPQTGRTIRLLHYGDSQIEMDRMTNRLRAYMQRTFGGGGPGLVPFATLIPSLSVSTYGSGSLLRQAPFGDSTIVRAAGNYGPMVQDFRLAGSATSTITAATNRTCDDRLRQFSRFTLLFCNRPGPLQATLSCRKQGYSQSQQQPGEGVHAFSWQLDSAAQSVQIVASGSADLYGVLVDDGPGVAVDNIPMRGCSGHQFTQINANQLKAAYGLMDVGLIILQFGGNSVPYLKGDRSISHYCKELGQQIDRLHQCCPQALILFVGPSDMSTREQGELQTYPCLPQVVDSLRVIATTHGAAYWSIYDAMGGRNSMLAWTEQGLGGTDYIHFSQRGADLMGDRLAKAFDNMYQLWKLKTKEVELHHETSHETNQE